MNITFNYRYYINSDEYETHQLTFKTYANKSLAYTLDEVGDVVHFAEKEQKNGRYVAIYLTYEAAAHFNINMATHHLEHGDLYAVAYSFDEEDVQPPSLENVYNYVPKHNFTFQESDEQMRFKIQQVQAAIVEGETYQVNYTTRLTSDIHYSISELYTYLTQTNNGGYTALLDTEDLQVASISPELFFQKGKFKGENDVIVSKPMKGTMPRSADEKEDELNYKTLQQSLKDRAENVMIVDLLRNDISRISETGTIKVYKPFFIETYKTVYQMTSMVTGHLINEISLHDILKALFPCGSITGAPKLNTMSYIKSLEIGPRSIYCGSIGLMMPEDKMIFNIPIRTLKYRQDKVIYGVGAGITIDSDPKNEVQEFRDKTKILEML
ncbi:anthranilate synthase component I family protein [Staphylococcus sp. NRL 16/872]|uniref:chorismate-binding protein n=1 Tax=Staphylococcus sp. NRL 16/872 TaxID=2930131 RepID=UPI001FB334F2|nr:MULTISPECIES: anthranilate synthase component I family protein [unclassified Staphylococcus]MCJ1656938.1 anthranilate synthase component I family protein [Staphylococcus sp. NRL 21/187]MCJ1662684.1 anthranilate synthase component I family protein [Staphylococcus sp. NRL 18/288]MCJ1668789.1 anthranilate synthase component I family protein [Staphylococcus sp. NRL 19/737]WEN69006.1 anthranilate synthase component I family protein [Staphylococcus sp. NRL 16/872]